MEEKEFINEAIKKGLVTFEQIQEALKTKEEVTKAGLAVAVWEVLVRKGFATQEQVDAVLSGAAPGAKAYPFGPYLIQAKIGEGGMGAVYRASKKGDDKVVALKLLPQRFASNAEYVKRFEREARICIAISDPHLIKGYEFGQINGRWYYAMEFVKGKVLSAVIKERKHLDEKTAVQTILQICRALDTIHKNGLVHRDVKPENVIISEEGIAKLMDLGLVKSTLSDLTQLTQSGFAVGTPHYMSPEQIQGTGVVDIRSDIYSLGATLYHAVTGAQPFKGSSAMEIINKQLRHELEDPRGYRPDLTDGIIHVMEKMMARDAKERYETPSQLLEDLALVLDGGMPKSQRLEVGRSMMRRRPAPPGGVRPAAGARVSRRIVKDAPTSRRADRKPSPWTLIGIGGGAAAVVLILGAMILSGGGRPTSGTQPPPGPNVAGPPPAPTATGPTEPGTTVALENSIRLAISDGRLNEAALLLKREAAALGEKKSADLAGLVRAAADHRWAAAELAAKRKMNIGSTREARDDLEAFRKQMEDVPGMAGRVDALLAEIAAFERESKLRAEADSRFKGIEKRIQPFERGQLLEKAMEILLAERVDAERTNPFLLRLIEDRIQWLETAIAKRGDPSPSPSPGPKPGPRPADPAVFEAVKRASELFSRKEFDKAAVALAEAIRADPTHAPAWALRAHCFLEKDIRPNAWTDAKRALELDATNPRALYVVGRVIVADNGNVQEAIAAFTRSIAGNPAFHDAYFRRAELFARTGSLDDALRDLSEAVRLDPASSTNPAYPALRVRIHELRGEIDKAIAACGEWIKAAPKEIDPWLKRADLQMETGSYKEARDDYTEALKLDPKNEQALQGRADANTAVRTGKRPDREPPPGAKPSPAEIRKKLGALLNASQEQYTQLKDGRFQATLVYDLSKQQQLDDFSTERSAWKNRTLEMTGDRLNPAALVFKPLVRGDMLVRVEYVFVNDQTQTGNGLMLRTTASAAVGQPGEGIGCRLQHNGTEWMVSVARAGSSPQTLSGDKSVNFGARDRLALALKRESNKFTGYFSTRFSAEAMQSGFEPAYLRFEANDPVRVTRIEIQAILDPDWLAGALGLPREAADPAATQLWNGRDLGDWESTGTGTVGPAGGEIVFNSPDGVGVLIHKNVSPLRSTRFEMVIAVEEPYAIPLIGFGIVLGGGVVSTEGNLAARWGSVYQSGPGIRIDRFHNRAWEQVQASTTTLAVQKGEYRLELQIDSTDVILRINGSVELKAPTALAGAQSFRIAIMLQDIKARVKSVTQK
jgi:tetratricopeptide (TPR) repeat protein